MKQYLLSVHHVAGEEQPAPDVIEAMYKDVEAFNEEMRAAGRWVFAGGLETPDIATVVRAHQGDEVLITDGPFPESKEQLGGFWVLKAEDLDEALELAKRASRACQGAVEVRPFQDDPED